MITEHVLYSHFCTANRPIFFNTQTLHVPEYSYPNTENMQPHYSQSSRENETPSSGTSPLACY